LQPTYDKILWHKITEKEKQGIIAKLKNLLEKENTVKLAWLFGSLTRRDSVKDIDIAIHSDPERSFKELLNLNAQIELELGLPVDMVEIVQVPESLRENIFTNGTLIKGNKSLQQQLQRATQ
jgi:predicted nucleotidyltransferase